MQNLAIASTLITHEYPSALLSANAFDGTGPNLLCEEIPQEWVGKLLDTSPEYAQWIRLASLRILMSPLGWKLMSPPGGVSADIIKLIGLPNFNEVVTTHGPGVARSATLAIMEKLEPLLPSPIVFGDKLQRNLNDLGKIVGLNETEEAVLGLAILFHVEPAIILVEDFLGMDLPAHAIPGIFATALGISPLEVKQALSGSSRLNTSGLLTLDASNGSTCISLHLDLISKSFATKMGNGEPISEVFGSMIRKASSCELTKDDYPHIDTQIELAIACLKAGAQGLGKAPTILLWGPAGVGKTSLARLLAEQAQLNASEIPETNENHTPMSPLRRARATRFAQALFKHNAREVLILDECEEIILAQSPDSDETITKSWINQFIENPSAPPTIFIANAINWDAATLRRFDLCIEVPIPPRPQRIRIIEDVCGGALSARTIQSIADERDLPPAIIAKAGRIARQTSESGTLPASIEETTLLVLNQHQAASGRRPIVVPEENGMGSGFDPRFSRTSHDLSQLRMGLLETRSARILADGPPGTGKTSLGKWLADALGQPLMRLKGSDLLDKYVGGVEQKTRAAFETAQRDGALLQIDEIETFIQDRGRAEHHWQISQVNEFLTSLDTFEGIFIATTNHAKGLDPACQRRFDLRIQFDYPDRETLRELYDQLATLLCLESPAASDYLHLDEIGRLTPGDFATARRRSRLIPIRSHADLLIQLRACAEWKPGSSRRIGF